MKKYFKIGELAELYQIGVDSIRYYEEIGLIKPERSEKGYRLYSIHDIWRLNVIRDLRSIGFNMDRIRQYLECHNTASTLKLLEEEQAAIDEHITILKKLQDNVNRRLSTLQAAKDLPINEISLNQLPPRRCHCLSEGYQEADEMDILIKRLINLDKNRLYIIGSNQVGTVISLDALLHRDQLSYQSVFVIDEQGGQKLPGGGYLCVTYRGAYHQSALWGRKLIEYAKNHGLFPTGDLLELLWLDIHTSSDEKEYITQLQLPVSASPPLQ